MLARKPNCCLTINGCLITSTAILVASPNTFFKPFLVRAEHSIYFIAPNFLASFSASSAVTGS